jgi:hypothetical protein
MTAVSVGVLAVIGLNCALAVPSPGDARAQSGVVRPGCIYATCPRCSKEVFISVCPNCRAVDQFGKHEYAMATPTQPAPGCRKCKEIIARVNCGECGTRIDVSLLRWKE